MGSHEPTLGSRILWSFRTIVWLPLGYYENPERRLMQIWVAMVSCIISRGDLIYLIKSLVLSSRYPTGKPIVDSISSRSGTIDQYYAIKLLDEIVNHFLTIASMDEGSTLKNLFCILSAKLSSGDRASVFQTVLQVILRNYITYDQGKGIGEGLSFLLSALDPNDGLMVLVSGPKRVE